MTPKTLEKKGSWKVAPRVAWRKVADEAIILDAETAVYYSLDGAGLRMWELLGEGKTGGEIARLLAGEFDATEETLREDFAELLGRLKREGLIVRA
jgi:hypothetical protein